jgi:hypothetical protein
VQVRRPVTVGKVGGRAYLVLHRPRAPWLRLCRDGRQTTRLLQPAIDGDDTVWVFNVGATKVDIGGPPPPAPDRTSNWKLDADPFLNPFVIAIGAPPRRSRRR